jgi:signal transduction histidine kinase/AraC-like DNA-binding protein/CheY-like chemotaxis protein
MTPPRRSTIGILPGYQLYEGNTISDYLHSVLQGAIVAAHHHGCNLLIAGGLDTRATRGKYAPAWPIPQTDTTFVPVGPWNTDGLIVIPPLVSDERSHYLQDLRADRFLVVFAGPGEDGPSVVTDNAGAVFQAVDHLHAHGHRQIAFIAGLESVTGDSSMRLEAFRAATKAFGIESRAGLIVYGQHTVEGGLAAMRTLLSSGIPFSAVVTSNLRSAIGAMQALEEQSRRCPQDIAIIAIDDRLEAEAQDPPLTTVHLNTFELGFQAVGLILEYLSGSRQEPVTISVPGRLVVRRSCGCRPQIPHPKPVADLATSPTEARIKQLASAVASVVGSRARQLAPAKIEADADHLVRALMASLVERRDDPFHSALNRWLTEAEVQEEDLQVFQGAIYVLLQQGPGLGLINTSGPAKEFAERLLDAALVTIGERSRRQIARYFLRQSQLADTLGTMTARLLMTRDEAEILTALETYLPAIGIQHVQVALLEAEDEDPIAWSLVWTRDPDTGSVVTERVSSRSYPPLGRQDSEQAFRAALLPLITQSTQIGFIALEAGHLEPCGAIARQVAAAITACRLYHQAMEGRRMAEEASQMKSRFLSTVSHELRTPLSLIVGLSEFMLREQSDGKASAREDLERIHTSAQHLSFLIRDVLDLASSEAGQLRLALEPVRLQDVLQPVLKTGEELARAKGLRWEGELPPDLPSVLGDPTRLRQVTLNLVDNAVKFTTHGSVTLCAEVQAEQILISVSDTGVGIPLAEQATIFDEFGQSTRTAARGFGGLGLGLAISKHLIELHGGTIGVRSSGVEGEGTTFFFTLPVLREFGAADVAGLQPGQPVLVLARTAEATAPVETYLRSAGLEVAAYAVGEPAMWKTKVKAMAPAAILLDRSLASDLGWQLIQALRAEPTIQGVPLLFYSLNPESAQGSVLELDYLTKPLSAEQLVGHLPASVAGKPALRTVLLVDDDAELLDLHARLMRSLIPDCQVHLARDGRQAIDLMRQVRPDLVLLDLMMPELDGFGVLEAMRAHPDIRDIPVVVLTAKVLTDGEMERLNQGVVAILEKGVVTAEEVLGRIGAALERTGRTGSSAQRLVRRAITYIHDHYAEPLSREHLARELAVSDNYLTNCFQKELGISPLTYINRYRVRQARGMLESGKDSITEVALAVGFSSLTYFARIFQREVGVSPSAYRRGLRRNPVL